jgi:hypothetical protein
MIHRIREWLDLNRKKTPDRKIRRNILFNHKLITRMIQMHCRIRHKQKLCPECRELLDYALKKLEICPLKNDKPPCSLCHIHCYQGEWKNRILDVMRFTGPVLGFRHPLLGMKFLRQKQLWQRRYNDLRL